MKDEIKEKVTWENFKIGSEFEGMLKKKNVRGGCLLYPATFTIK